MVSILHLNADSAVPDCVGACLDAGYSCAKSRDAIVVAVMNSITDDVHVFIICRRRPIVENRLRNDAMHVVELGPRGNDVTEQNPAPSVVRSDYWTAPRSSDEIPQDFTWAINSHSLRWRGYCPTKLHDSASLPIRRQRISRVQARAFDDAVIVNLHIVHVQRRQPSRVQMQSRSSFDPEFSIRNESEIRRKVAIGLAAT